jgi:hypothetical protein
MEARAFGLVAVFAIIVGFAAMLHYSEDVDELNRDHDGAKAGLESVEKNIAVQQSVIDEKELALNKLEALISKITPLEKAIAEKRKNTAKFAEDVAAQEYAFDDAVANVRQSAANIVIGSLLLNSGKTLTDVKVKSVSADHISVSHSLGAARLRKADLPFEIVDRFKLEDAIAVDARAKTVASTEEGASADGSPPAPIAKVDPKIARAKVKEMQGQIATLRAQVSIASGSQALFQRRAYEYRDLHNAARSAGRSSSHLIQANAVQASADLMEKQMIAAQARIDYLRSQIFALMSDID